MDNEKLELQGEPVSENIWLCPDGVYRWTYEMDMLKNPTIMISVWKVLGISFGVVLLFDLIVSLFGGDLKTLDDLLGVGKLFLILAAIFLVLSVISYIILAALYGWKYQVLFEMDEEKVVHIQMPKQYEKALALGWLTAMAGLAARSITTAGAGVLSASKDTSTSRFEDVRTVKGVRSFHTIKISQRLERNQVYAAPADFDFVWSYITEHCVNAKIR